MKSVTLHLSAEQLTQVLTETQEGDTVVLTDGERQLTLKIEPEDGRPELAAEFFLAPKKTRPKYSREQIEEVEEIKEALKQKEETE
jgi:hypothetical protein